VSLLLRLNSKLSGSSRPQKKIAPAAAGAISLESAAYWLRTGPACCRRFVHVRVECAGVPGLEPRMAEPESAVLPITPYPIGCLKQLVKGFPQTM
jgi:hypothetical protein